MIILYLVLKILVFVKLIVRNNITFTSLTFENLKSISHWLLVLATHVLLLIYAYGCATFAWIACHAIQFRKSFLNAFIWSISRESIIFINLANSFMFFVPKKHMVRKISFVYFTFHLAEVLVGACKSRYDSRAINYFVEFFKLSVI